MIHDPFLYGVSFDLCRAIFRFDPVHARSYVQQYSDSARLSRWIFRKNQNIPLECVVCGYIIWVENCFLIILHYSTAFRIQ